MVKLVVAYGQPDDPAAFDRYYTEKHIPIAQKIPDVQRFEAGKGARHRGRVGRAVLLHRRAVVRLPRGAAVGDAERRGTGGRPGCPNFATGGATLMVAEA